MAGTAYAMQSIPTQGGPGLAQVSNAGAFDMMDRNHDGVITREEFGAALAGDTGLVYAAEPIATRVPTQETVQTIQALPPTGTVYGGKGAPVTTMPMATMTVQTTIGTSMPISTTGTVPTMPQAYTSAQYAPQYGSYQQPQYMPTASPPMTQTTYVTTASPPQTQYVVQGTVAGAPQVDTMSEAFKAFDMFDKNGDGAITQAEFKEVMRTKIFDMFDKNKNGVISREELEQAMAHAEESGNFMQTMMALLKQMESAPAGGARAVDGQYEEPQQGQQVGQSFLQCVCGSLFLDDSSFCRKCGADRSIAETMLQLECNETLFADELAQLPGGQDALRFLRKEFSDELPPGWVAKQDDAGRTYYENTQTGEKTWDKPFFTAEQRRQALNQISKSIQSSKEKAIAMAKDQKLKAAQMEKAARDAKDLSAKAVAEDQNLEVEHQMLAELAQKHRDAEAKADQDAQRLAALAQQAMLEAQQLQDDYLKAHDHHQNALGHHQNVSGRHAEARGRLGPGMTPAQAQQQAKAQEQAVQQRYLQAAKKAHAAKTASEAATQKMQRLLDEMNQLESYMKPGAENPLLELSQHQAQATLKQAQAIRLRKKAEDMMRQAEEMKQEAEYAMQVASQAEAASHEQAQIVAEETEKVRSMHPGGILPNEAGMPGGLTPEELAKKLQQLRAEVAQAQAQAQHQAALAQQEDANAAAAHQALEQCENDLEAHDAADQLHEEEALAKLMADQSHAKALAAQQAAAAAARHAAICHQRSEEGRKKLEDQSKHAQNAHNNERNAWAKRFGDGSQPRGAAPENEGQLEAQRAAEMAADAQVMEQNSKKAEIEAYKLEMLVQAIERAKQVEEKLRPEYCCCGHRFIEDANFCRACGRPRMQSWAWGGFNQQHQSLYGGQGASGVDQVRTEAKMGLAEIDTMHARAEAGPAKEQGPSLTATMQNGTMVRGRPQQTGAASPVASYRSAPVAYTGSAVRAPSPVTTITNVAPVTTIAPVTTAFGTATIPTAYQRTASPVGAMVRAASPVGAMVRQASPVVYASAVPSIATAPTSMFDQMDRNGDGVITRAEFAQYAVQG